MDKGYLLDTSVILAAVLGTNDKAKQFLFSPDLDLHTIEYVIKEIYHVLLYQYGLTKYQIGLIIDEIRSRVKIHKNPPVKAYKKLNIRDKSDRPIVCAAILHNCVLIIRDEMTYRDAKKYVEAIRLDDLQV